jgi:phosphohistidine phosphatase
MTALYVVRHAIAEQRDAERWPDDAQRPLTAKGEASFRRASRGLRMLVAEVAVVLSSPYVRAWRTAEILEEEAGWPPPEPCEPLEAVREPGEALEALRPHAGRDAAAVVGHEPYLSGLVSILLAGEPGAVATELKKGGVVCLELPGEASPGGAVLRWSATPRMLRRLGRG